MRTSLRLLVVAAAALIVAGCGGSTSDGTSPSATAAEPTYVAATLNCDQYVVRATNFYSHAYKSGLNIGTTNAIDDYVTEMQNALADLQLNAPECAPEAGDELAALGAAVTTYAEAYEPSTDAAVSASNSEALDALAAQGKVAWTAMGLDPTQWDGVQ